MIRMMPECALTVAVIFILAGCVSHVYVAGTADNPLHQISLGQTYGDMVRVLGPPDHSVSVDRKGQEAAILLIPVWNIVESVGNYNPSMMQVYVYDQFGKVTIDDNNHIIRVEARQ